MGYPCQWNHNTYVSSVFCMLLPKLLKAHSQIVGEVSGATLVEDNLVSVIQSRNFIRLFHEVKIIKHSVKCLKDCIL